MRIALPIVLVSLLLAAPTQAHHSTAMFDPTKSVTLKGTLKELQWTNPHSWIQILADGKEWSIECGSPNSMSRQGWTRTAIKPGEPITLVMRPMKDGTAAGMLLSVTLPDGRVLGSGATGAPPPVPAAR